MRKADLRKHAAEQLALLGYSSSQYVWAPGRLRILTDAQALPNGNPRPVMDARNSQKTEDPLAGCYIELKLVAGGGRKASTKKHIRSELERVPRRGEPVRCDYAALTLVKSTQLEAF